MHLLPSNSDVDAAAREAMITGFLRHAALGSHDDEYSWAWDAVGDFVRHESPVASWSLVLDLIQRASTDLECESVSAGPLEELVGRHGALLLETIEDRARADTRVRDALADIWLSEGQLAPEVLARIVSASGDRIQPLPPLANEDDSSRP